MIFGWGGFDGGGTPRVGGYPTIKAAPPSIVQKRLGPLYTMPLIIRGGPLTTGICDCGVLCFHPHPMSKLISRSLFPPILLPSPPHSYRHLPVLWFPFQTANRLSTDDAQTVNRVSTDYAQTVNRIHANDAQAAHKISTDFPRTAI